MGFFIENLFEYVTEKDKTDKKNTKKIKPQEKDIIQFCKDAKSLKEIANKFGFKDITTFKKNYINLLLEKDTLQLTILEQPKNRNQKYIKNIDS